MSSSDETTRPRSSQVTHVQNLFIARTGAIQAFLLTMLPDFHLVDDVLQEVFLIVTEKAESFEEGSNFLAWACQIAKLKALEAQRQQHAMQVLSPEVLEALWASYPTTQPPQEQRYLALRKCLDKLGPQARQIVELRYREAIKPAEIARQLSWTAGSVYVGLSRARQMLRQCVEQSLKRGES